MHPGKLLENDREYSPFVPNSLPLLTAGSWARAHDGLVHGVPESERASRVEGLEVWRSPGLRACGAHEALRGSLYLV